MSGEGHLRELERMLDHAVGRWKAFDDPGHRSAVWFHGQAQGVARAMALIARTSPTHEMDEALKRKGLTR